MGNTAAHHGTPYGPTTKFNLDDDEFVTRVEGYSSDNFINQLTFVTNKRMFYFIVTTTTEGFKSDFI